MSWKERPPLKPLSMDADGSYRKAQEALGLAVAETAYLTGLDRDTIAAQALIAACIELILNPGYAWAFRAMLERAEAQEMEAER